MAPTPYPDIIEVPLKSTGSVDGTVLNDAQLPRVH